MNKVKNYTNYDVVSFATDESFQEWVWRGHNASYWKQVLRLHPAKSEDIHKAKKLLQSIGFRENWPSDDKIEQSLADALKNLDSSDWHQSGAIGFRLFRDRWVWASVAASIFFLVLGVWLGYQFGDDRKAGNEWMVNSKTIDGNKLTEIASAEGFKFILASNTQLTYKEEDSKSATIYLDGAAQLDFGKSNRQYVINTNKVVTQAQKAKINISAFSGDSLVKISVKEGVAELKGVIKTAPMMELIPPNEAWDKVNKIEIKTNEEMVFNKGSNTTTIKELDPGITPFMKLYQPSDKHPDSQIIRFDQATLDDVLLKLTQHYHLQFERDKEYSMQEPTFSGTFNLDENPFNILIMACMKFGLTYEIKNGVIAIRKAAKSIK